MIRLNWKLKTDLSCFLSFLLEHAFLVVAVILNSVFVNEHELLLDLV